MFRALTFVSLLTILGAAVLVGGCSKSPERTPPKAPAGPGQKGPAAEHKDHDAEKDHGTGQAAPDEKPAGLTAADRALIEKQKTCPVTGEALGSMGEPVKVVVKGQTVFLCCAGCEAAIKKDADKYLAKLNK